MSLADFNTIQCELFIAYNLVGMCLNHTVYALQEALGVING